MLLSAATSQLLVVDMQERLMPAVADGEAVLASACKLVLAASRLSVPVSASEQHPQRLGPTVGPMREALGATLAHPKLAFSCARDEVIAARIERLCVEGRDRLVVCGVEAHVCVLQTAIDFCRPGCRPAVVSDAAASRDPRSHALAMRRLEAAGVEILNTEMVLFEWLERAGTPGFRDLLALIK
jgi:nicotinamidase-related amidase